MQPRRRSYLTRLAVIVTVMATTGASATAVTRTTRATKKARTTTTKRPATTTTAKPKAVAGTTSISVASNAGQYFVLFVKPDPNGTREVPVAIARGVDGTTVLTDRRTQLPQAHYRVAAFPVSAPGDVDGDGTDDLTELNSATGNPLNPAAPVDAVNGMLSIPNRATFEKLSYQGPDVAIDTHLSASST